ncbi:hypothetical protein Pint_19251 [Pistacia integerrima]|uniref:Uncharacterized protein n=1 Tax=Pistacia integerrima TaxID=434235 RepID=A0ACC0YWY1_9ROSI|nr:hypothetical protein Pint_19251 [Pistacia integerrima]
MAILKTIWFFVILVSIINVDGRTSISIEEDKELEQQLKLLNQPALKTIKTKHGDVIDCVDIHKQPSLNHPLLKNHTIQMKPSAFPKELRRGKTTLSSSTNLTEIKLRRVACPRGTVPIPRIQKEHLIRIKSMVGYWPANLFNLLKDNAKSVVWGGATYSPGNETGLEMGSGQFLPNQESKTSYAGDLMVVDGWNRYRELNNYKIDTYADKPDCYAVDYRGSIGEPLGYNVLFGGPGGLKCGK